MQNYENPLDHFRSFSYHFILTVASNTEAFRKLVPSGPDSGGRSAVLTAVNDVHLGDELPTSKDTYLVIDTRRFSQYSITELDMEHVYGTGPQNNPTTPITTTKLQIKDATGLSFFNMLMDIFRKKLKTTQSSAFFLLTIVFTGHTDTGATETISTCNIPMTMLALDFEFTSSGSIFEIQMMEQEAGPSPRGASQEHLTGLGPIKSITTKDRSNTLGGMIAAFEDKLNIQSLDWYQKFGGKGGTTRRIKGKLVQYMITVPEDIAQMKITNATRNKRTEQMYVSSRPKDTASTETKKAPSIETIKNEDVISGITFSDGTNIMDAIRLILETSDDFLLTASTEARENCTGYVIKIVTSVTSDDATYVVHFDVYKMPIVNTKKEEDADTAKNKKEVVAAGQVASTANSEIPNLIKYDYIFSGANSHILSLIVKFENAITAFDTNLSVGSNRLGTNAQSGQNKAESAKTHVPPKSSSGRVPDLGESDPIFISITPKEAAVAASNAKTNEALDNTEAAKQIRSKMEYEETYGYLHFASSLMLDVGIRGNPNLIRKYADRNTRGGFPPHYKILDRPTTESLIGNNKATATSIFNTQISGKLTSAKGRYIEEYLKPRLAPKTGTDPLLSGPDVNAAMVYVKLNIQAPNTDSAGNSLAGQGGVDSSGNKTIEGAFTDKFFFKGVYRLLKIRTTFSGGMFKHDLQLIPDLDKLSEAK